MCPSDGIDHGMVKPTDTVSMEINDLTDGVNVVPLVNSAPVIVRQISI